MKLYDLLTSALKLENDFIDDRGELKTQVVISRAMSGDETLLRRLLTTETLKAEFFREVAGCLLFDRERFINFLQQRQYLKNSYTAYKQSIGLAHNGEFLRKSTDVELVWPYKDCVLEGGQTSEEQKRDEIFFNRTLALDEITQLFEPKVLTNCRRYDVNGCADNESFNRDAKINEYRGLATDTITENLIIKGNNLLALHSLRKEFAGKVKLIFIDPPYNTDNDSFGYNDSFSRSTWLTFMKNRLEIAKEILRTDGIIFIECDKNEGAYLKVLLDEIFGEENFISDISVQTSYANGLKVKQKFKTILKMKDTVYVYKKQDVTIKPQYVEKKYWDTHYDRILVNNNGELSFKPLKEELISLGILPHNATIKAETIDNPDFYKYVCDHRSEICCLNPIHSNGEMRDIAKQSNGKIIEYTTPTGKIEYLYNGRQVGFFSQCFHDVNGMDKLSILLGDIWTDIDFGNNQNEGGVSFPSAKKPEHLLRRIIDMTTQEGDIVLDFFAGSGTTGAVAHKMNRQYILCEQMERQVELITQRLNNVINSEQGGISKVQNWQGGGSFVYMELKTLNEKFIREIEAVTTSEQLLDILERMKERSFLDANMDLERVEQNKEKFIEMTVAEQKRVLCEMLDMNQLYVNRSMMDDAETGCTPEEKIVTRAFYKER